MGAHRFVALALFAAASQARSALAQEAQGYAEVRLGLFPGATGDVWQVIEHVRPSFETEIVDRVKLVATVDAALRQGRDLTGELESLLLHSDLAELFLESGCQFPTSTNESLHIDDSSDYLEVDRLYLDVYAGEIDFRLGRQSLNWGSAQFFNPTDPFPEVLLSQPWRPRRGVNALRVSVPFGEVSDATGVVALDDALLEPRAAGRLRFNFLDTDLALVGAWRGSDHPAFVGVDLRGTLEVGWWFEGAVVLGDGDQKVHEELAVGIDYSFPLLERATAFLQYYRNGGGTATAGGAQRIAASSGVLAPVCTAGTLPFGASEAPDPFAPFVQGRNYLLFGGSLLIDPELSVALAWLQNLDDGSGFIVPTVSYNLLDWLDASLSAQVPFALWGHGGELAPDRSELVLSVAGLSADLSGLLPVATINTWMRASF